MDGVFSTGLEYSIEKNGTVSVCSIGSCTDKHIRIPEFIDGKTVTAVAEGAFAHSYSIISVVLPASVSLIGKNAFSWCKELTTINAPGTLEICERAFMGCGKLEDICLGSRVKCINDKAFAYCNSLTSAYLPNSINKLGHSVFEGCTSLNYASLPEALTAIDSGMFYACTELKQVTIPTDIKYIDEYAFAYCISLGDIDIPAETVINQDAFFECLLKKAS